MSCSLRPHNEWIEITEISESGSVPELFLKNHSEQFVLILDGEELIGPSRTVSSIPSARPPEAKMEIPVSCTEQGRWSYSGPEKLSPVPNGGRLLVVRSKVRI